MLPDDKIRLRHELRLRRRAMPAAEVESLSARVAAGIRDWLPPGACVGFFAATRNEPVLDRHLKPCDWSGTWAFPRADVGALALTWHLMDEAPTEPGAFGIREPRPGDALVPPERLDVILVPGLAFAPCGARLGSGAGFYDRFLPRLRPDVPRVGVAWEWQLLAALTSHDHDIPMTHLATETGVRPCAEVGRDPMSPIS